MSKARPSLKKRSKRLLSPLSRARRRLSDREQKFFGSFFQKRTACLAFLLVAGIAHASDKVVLVAGDDSLPVFDNAAGALQARLHAVSADVQRLSASAAGAHAASLQNVLAAVAAMRPQAGQGCFVFATSHGGEHEGLYLSDTDDFLTPRALDAALVRGCGDAPTVVVVSACFSGSFARAPMTRANRIVLTAARADRTSFGCQAGRTYTVFDKCLLDSLETSTVWQTVYGLVRRCVSREEVLEGAVPSHPQAWFGAQAAR